jgi:UDP-2,3-diacylglucosamine hydrolase
MTPGASINNGSKLGIIAGEGDLPARIIAACRDRGRPFFVLALEGRTAPVAVGDTPHAWVRLGAAGKALKLLRREKVEELVLAGPVSRPTLAELKPDLWAAKFLAKKGKQVFDNDDGLLGALIRELEETEGFRVLQAEALLANP